MQRLTALAIVGLVVVGSAQAQVLRGDALKAALRDEAADFWIYDDIAAGFDRAREAGKPLLVSIRCVP